MGMTLGPREATQARESWAAVMPFFSAMLLSPSTSAMLCLKYSSLLKRENLRRMSPSTKARQSELTFEWYTVRAYLGSHLYSCKHPSRILCREA